MAAPFVPFVAIKNVSAGPSTSMALSVPVAAVSSAVVQAGRGRHRRIVDWRDDHGHRGNVRRRRAVARLEREAVGAVRVWLRCVAEGAGRRVGDRGRPQRGVGHDGDR